MDYGVQGRAPAKVDSSYFEIILRSLALLSTSPIAEKAQWHNAHKLRLHDAKGIWTTRSETFSCFGRTKGNKRDDMHGAVDGVW